MRAKVAESMREFGLERGTVDFVVVVVVVFLCQDLHRMMLSVVDMRQGYWHFFVHEGPDIRLEGVARRLGISWGRYCTPRQDKAQACPCVPSEGMEGSERQKAQTAGQPAQRVDELESHMQIRAVVCTHGPWHTTMLSWESSHQKGLNININNIISFTYHQLQFLRTLFAARTAISNKETHTLTQSSSPPSLSCHVTPFRQW